jgi:hypothetical protein
MRFLFSEFQQLPPSTFCITFVWDSFPFRACFNSFYIYVFSLQKLDFTFHLDLNDTPATWNWSFMRAERFRFLITTARKPTILPEQLSLELCSVLYALFLRSLRRIYKMAVDKRSRVCLCVLQWQHKNNWKRIGYYNVKSKKWIPRAEVRYRLCRI